MVSCLLETWNSCSVEQVAQFSVVILLHTCWGLDLGNSACCTASSVMRTGRYQANGRGQDGPLKASCCSHQPSSVKCISCVSLLGLVQSTKLQSFKECPFLSPPWRGWTLFRRPPAGRTHPARRQSMRGKRPSQSRAWAAASPIASGTRASRTGSGRLARCAAGSRSQEARL